MHAATAVSLLLSSAALCAQVGAAPQRSVTQLTSLPLRTVSQGWGQLGSDVSVQGAPLRIGERSFAFGIGTHAHSDLTWLLGGGCTRFRAWVGVDAEVAAYVEASVVFRVLGDGRELFASDVRRAANPALRVDVDVTGVQVLRLVVDDAGDGIYADHADWAEAELLGSGPVAATPPAGSARYRVVAPTLTVELTDVGSLCAVVVPDGARTEVRGWTVPGGAGAAVDTTVQEVDGGVAAIRSYALDAHRTVLLTESFRPLGDGVRWQVEVRSRDDRGGHWTMPIDTVLRWAEPSTLRLWTAGGGPAEWRDPLLPEPFGPLRREYGAFYNRPFGLSLPLVTVLDDRLHRGITLLQSPDDVLFDLSLATTADGELRWSHALHRLGDADQPLVFHRDLVLHAQDPRAALRAMVQRYPAWFEPPLPRAGELGGGGAYSGHEGELDAARLQAMDFTVNWKASLDFPYMGMFLPPVADGERWNRFAGGGGGRYEAKDEGRFGQTSTAAMEDYNRAMHALGFHVLSYFNVTEFGGNIVFPPPARRTEDPAQLWRDANDFLHGRLANAVLRAPAPTWTWGGAVVMDCGDPDYRAFLLEQARRQLEKLPSVDGICIDRMDWLVRYNPHADDGLSWIDGPQRSLLRSWNTLLEQLGPLLHGAGKVIFVNDMVRRLELMRHVDGFYDEHGMWAYNLNASAFLALGKPLICWTPDERTLAPDADRYFQQLLYLGAFPTVPFPGNDHTIRPGTRADADYLAYGPLFAALRGRRWVLLPEVVAVADGAARANVFEVPGGFVVAVVLGGEAEVARVRLRGLPLAIPGAAAKATVRLPGAAVDLQVEGRLEGGDLRFEVPLRRGAALLLLRRGR